MDGNYGETQKQGKNTIAALRRKLKSDYTTKLSQTIQGCPQLRNYIPAEIVKGIDKIAWQQSKKNTTIYIQCFEKLFMQKLEEINSIRMKSQTASAQLNDRQLSNNEMLQIMIEELPNLQRFKEHTTFVGKDDLTFLTRLISFIEQARSLSTRPQVVESNIPVYYARLFLPIHEQMNKQNRVPKPRSVNIPSSKSASQQRSQIAPSQPPIAQQPPAISPSQLQPSTTFTQVPASMQSPAVKQQAASSVFSKNPSTLSPPPQPQSQPLKKISSNLPQMSHSPPESDYVLSRRAIAKLFTAVRSDCAVFYATPHPPHF